MENVRFCRTYTAPIISAIIDNLIIVIKSQILFYIVDFCLLLALFINKEKPEKQ